MPKGERTVLCAFKKAIMNAERYIYIEEQFLWDCEIADFIYEQRRNNNNLHLIVVLAATTDIPITFGQYAYDMRSRFFMRVLGVERKAEMEIAFGDATKVYAYGLFQKPANGGKPIYVHSKLMIIDDRYVAVGSANMNARSMHVDTELTLAVVDDDTEDVDWSVPTGSAPKVKVCKFARELRERLWKEHLCLTKALGSEDPIKVLATEFPNENKFPNMWTNKKDAKKAQIGHVRPYINNPGTFRTRRPFFQHILDRNQKKLIQ